MLWPLVPMNAVTSNGGAAMLIAEGPKLSDRIAAMNSYIDGKMKRYNLLWAVNGGAFAVARLLPPGGDATGVTTAGDPDAVLGGLSLGALALGALALGASLFTVVMCVDIWMFGQMMRAEYFGGTTVFGTPGRIVLGLIGALIVVGWLLAAFG
jgi:hypothetical protein